MKGLIRAHCLNLFFLTMLGPVVRGKGKTFKRFIRTKSYLVCFAVARARERDMLVIFGKGQIYLADQARYNLQLPTAWLLISWVI